MNRSEIIKFLILRTVGNFLVLFAIFGALATFGPALYYEVGFRVAQARGVKYIVSSNVKTLPAGKAGQNSNLDETIQDITPTPAGQSPQGDANTAPSTGVDNFAQVLLGAKEQVLVPKDTDFSILIPKIGASAKVFPNIDPSSENDFLPVLKQGVAHAKGTVFPGLSGNIYLFAHSTDNFWNVGRYNAIFYLIKDLKEGDEVVVFFDGKRYNYVVTGSKIANPDEVSYITQAKTGQEQLNLQTCWPPGTTFQRLLVFAKPK